MSDFSVATGDEPAEDSSTEDRARRSTVAFPYVALDEAVEAARAIHANAGRECELAQLAAWLGTTVASSKFRSTISAARMFNLVQRRAKTISLTELGAAIVDPEQQDGAAVDAFLHVPLYRQVYDIFCEKLLPPDTGLEAELRSLGVTEKSIAKARQVLQRSATYAGFFRAGRNRLVRPASGLGPQETPQTPPNDDEVAENEQSMHGRLAAVEVIGPTDPLLRGLWSKLPTDGPFSASEQKQWLQMADLALRMVYGDDDLAATPALRISQADAVPAQGHLVEGASAQSS